MSVYDRLIINKIETETQRIIVESVNIEQAAEKFNQPRLRRKSRAMRVVTNKLIRTGKPVCTTLGIINPTKLNISHLNLKGLVNG